METKEGYQFKAKPMGNRALKQWYRDHIEELKGQIHTEMMKAILKFEIRVK